MNHISKYLTDYFIAEHRITDATEFSIEDVDALSLFVPGRIDLVAKWLYVDFIEKGIDSDYATKLYSEHIGAFSLGNYTEPGTPEKNSIEKYLKEFNDLIKSIKVNGFYNKRSLVPVGGDGIALDGSHRIAICAYFNIPIKIVRFKNIYKNYDTSFFKKRGLDAKYLDHLVTQYCKLKKDTYAVCIWPQAYAADKSRKADMIIKKSGIKVVFKKSVTLNYLGIRNLLLQIYGHHEWTGDYRDKFKGTERKVNEVYSADSKTILYILESDDSKLIDKIKIQIRDAYSLNNSSVHITDNQEETVQITNLLLNDNSIHHLNSAELSKYSDAHELLDIFKKTVTESSSPLDDYIIESGSVLSLYGIRKTTDFDYLTSIEDKPTFTTARIDNHNSEMKYHTKTKDDLIYNPENYFYFNDVKCLSIENVLTSKKNRGEAKDKNDITLVGSYLNKNSGAKIQIRFIKIKISLYRNYMLKRSYLSRRLRSAGLREPLIKVRNTFIDKYKKN